MQFYNHIGVSSFQTVKIILHDFSFSFFCYANDDLIKDKHFLFVTVLCFFVFHHLMTFRSMQFNVYIGISELHISHILCWIEIFTIMLTLSCVFITGPRWLKTKLWLSYSSSIRRVESRKVNTTDAKLTKGKQTFERNLSIASVYATVSLLT